MTFPGTYSRSASAGFRRSSQSRSSVLNSGALLAVSGYGYQDSRITYSLVGGGSGVISTDDVDWTTTTRVNAKRGVRVTLHSSHAPSGTPGF